MNQEETILKFMIPLNNNVDNEFVKHVLLKLNNKNNNKYRDNDNYNDNYNDRPRKGEVQINPKHATDNHKTPSTNQTHPRMCPAYPFCVERNTAAKILTTDQENSILNNELPPTLRDLLIPIKQTALRMKQLSQLNNDVVPQNESVSYKLTQKNDFHHDHEDVPPTSQSCAMKFDEFELNSNNFLIPQDDNVFKNNDKLDNQVFLRILTKPETETRQIVVDPLLSVIQQIVSNMSEVRQEKLEVQLCKNTKKVCPLCPGCLKPRPIIDESRKVEDRGVQFEGSFRPEPFTFDDDSLSIQSYEFVKTMDVGCECKVETTNDETCFSPINNEYSDRHEKSNCDENDEFLDKLVSNILSMLTNDHATSEIQHSNPIDSSKPKSRELRNSTNEVSSNTNKSIDCTCELNYDSELRSVNKIEVTNELLDVATSTYSISIFGQMTSMLQMKSVKSRKQSSSTQCDIGPESIRKILPNTIESRKKPIFDSQKIPRIEEQDRDYPEIIEKLCPCGCGYFLEGDSTCSCGCAQDSNSPCVVTNHFNQIKQMTEEFTINSSNDSKTSDEKTIKSKKKSTHEKINSQFCICKESSSNVEYIPIDPLVKRMNDNVIAIQNSILHSEKKIEINCKRLNDNKQLDLEEEARKLQEKIERYRKENEYFRKLIQQGCNSCQKNAEILSRSPPIRATYSGLATAIEILQAKCRSKDSMIAILAEGLRGVVNYAQIARNLAAPCLEYSYWDFDRSTLYTYLRNTMSKLSLEESKHSTLAPNHTTEDNIVPPPKEFKVVQEFARCLLLSWMIPEDLKNVDGYRIYVNGNLAINVRSSKRTETIVGFVDSSKATELKLHSFNKNGILSDPVTITYSSKNENNDCNN
ncbi:uncharacterized protein LOC122517559 [Polistes fuscatus]|uniref:uncharacterized protein LOC122517559 n=1 Tax=Polistes fuscatus TaxID=30207 RepID=UPI001CA90912|nr:uncharacterized protein LOC122517559 [Polistes fuscatus]